MLTPHAATVNGRSDTAGSVPPPDPSTPPGPGEPAWPDPIGEEAFHGPAGEFVRLIDPATEADPVAVLLQLLVAFGSAAGRNAYFTAEADRHHPNEFAVLVGRSAKGRKGSSWGHVYRLMAAIDPGWAGGRVASGLSSGEGLIWSVRDPITTRQPVKEKGRVAGYEEVESDPGVADKRLLVQESEFANVLKQTDRQGNTLSMVVRDAWDRGTLATLTKNSPARATGAHVSIVGHVTADELRRYLSATETANGFGNRFLFACVRRSKLLPEGGRVDEPALASLTARFAAALAFAREGREVRRDAAAREVWCGLYAELSAERPGIVGSLLARAEAHVMRLALIYALLDRSPVIRPEHLAAAVAVWDYAEQSVRHVFGDSLGDPLADDLLRLLRGCPAGLTRTEISNYLARNASSAKIGAALDLLARHGLARAVLVETGGRPAERWVAVGRRG